MIRDHIGTVQGLTTALYAIGMAALAHAAHSLSESALWPLVTKRTMTIQQIETYLEASRGSIPSSPSALFAARTTQAVIVLVCTVMVTLVPLSSAPLVGFVYEKRNMTVPFQSSYQPGGGIGQTYKQTRPLQSFRAGAASFYTSWASGLASEPLPEYRDWFVDRTNLTQRGDLSVMAVKVKQNVHCHSWSAPRPDAADKKGSFIFATNAKKSNEGGRHGKNVKVLARPRLAVWLHEYEFLSASRIKTTLAFAALNGTISGGTMIDNVPEGVKNVVNISTVACDIELELVDDHLIIGQATDVTKPVPITSLSTVRLREDDRPEETLNELALWFSVAPITNGASVSGAQPMYTYKNSGLPMHFTTTGLGGRNDEWTIEYIENFIKVAMGAAALGDSTNWPNGSLVEFTSFKDSVKLDPSRPLLLLVPPLVILLCATVLLICNLYMHTRLQLPIMRLATLSEFLKSSQTEDLRRTAMNDMQISNRSSRLGKFAVEFGPTSSGLWGLMGSGSDRGLLGERELDRVISKHVPQETIAYEGFQG